MMNIDEMSDQEKSMLLARAMGWGIHPGVGAGMVDDESRRLTGIMFGGNLYDPANMALAWRVLNWASDRSGVGHPEESDPMQYKIHEWLTYNVGWLDIQPPADAQRLWLDQILTLAIEAGVTVVRSDE